MPKSGSRASGRPASRPRVLCPRASPAEDEAAAHIGGTVVDRHIRPVEGGAGKLLGLAGDGEVETVDRIFVGRFGQETDDRLVLAAEEVAPLVDEHEKERRFPAEVVRRIGELGWLGINVPERWGGAGMDTLAYAIAVEEIGRVWGSLGLIYDKDEVDPPPTSWEVLWDEQYAGRIIVLDDTNNNIVNAAIILGYEDPFNLTDEQLETVKQKLIEQKKVLLSYFAGFEEGNNVWESGNAVLMFSMGEFQAVDLEKRGYNVAYIIPEEGGVGWVDCWAISKGGRNKDLANALVD